MPTAKHCGCRRRLKEGDYHESPKGTRHCNEIPWSDNSADSMIDLDKMHDMECNYRTDDAKRMPFSEAFGRSYLSVIGVHAEGEPYDIAIKGIGLNDVAGDDIVEQQGTLQSNDWHRSILLNEPRGRFGMNAAVILPPTCPCTDKGIIFMRNNFHRPGHDSYRPISVTGLICATRVMLEYETGETDGIGVRECSMVWDTVAGPVTATALVKMSANASWCARVDVENVPSFVLGLDYQVYCPAIGTVTVDIAFGGVFCAFVDSSSLDLKIELNDVTKMVELGELIKQAINVSYECSHLHLPFLKHVSNVVFIEPILTNDAEKIMAMATVVSPGRLDRSPSGNATSARLAILHKHGEIGEEELKSQSVAGGTFSAAIVGHTKVGECDAVLTRIGGRAWAVSIKDVGFGEDDPFLEGLRLDDLWSSSGSDIPEEGLVGLGIGLDGETLGRRPDQNSLLGETY